MKKKRYPKTRITGQEEEVRRHGEQVDEFGGCASLCGVDVVCLAVTTEDAVAYIKSISWRAVKPTGTTRDRERERERGTEELRGGRTADRLWSASTSTRAALYINGRQRRNHERKKERERERENRNPHAPFVCSENEPPPSASLPKTHTHTCTLPLNAHTHTHTLTCSYTHVGPHTHTSLVDALDSLGMGTISISPVLDVEDTRTGDFTAFSPAATAAAVIDSEAPHRIINYLMNQFSSVFCCRCFLFFCFFFGFLARVLPGRFRATSTESNDIDREKQERQHQRILAGHWSSSVLPCRSVVARTSCVRLKLIIT